MISIITPTYQSGKYINTCIEGVQKQDIDQDIEHIIIDNNSIDETQNIIHNYLENTDANIIHIREKDNGHHEAISKGIILAKGNYIGVCNSSDFYSFTKWLSIAIKTIDESNSDCVYGITKIVDEDSLLFTKSFGCIKGWFPFETNWKKYLNTGLGFNECSAIFKASAIKSLIPMIEINHPWLDIQFRFYQAGFNSIYLPLSVATTRLHKNSLSKQNGKELEKKAFDKLHIRIKKAKQNYELVK